MSEKQGKIPQKIKVLWVTKCPICGKSHTHLWFKLKSEKTKTYEAKCSESEEFFEKELDEF